MSDRPIIFSAPMVNALLDGRKTMTRRLAWRDAEFGLQDYASEQLEEMDAKGWNAVGEGNEGQFRVYKPTRWQRVNPGDRLWVRETWAPHASGADYAADIHEASLAQAGPWRSPIHMGRRASRLTLIITATKVERLDQISEDDAKAEGAMFHDGHGVGHSGWRHDQSHGYVHKNARTSFACLWDRLHGEGSFNACQEVVALTFTVHKCNIDSIPKAVAEKPGLFTPQQDQRGSQK